MYTSPPSSLLDNGNGMQLWELERGMTLGHCTKKGQLGQYGRGLKTASTRLGADVVIFTTHKDNPSKTSIALLSFMYLKKERKDSTTIPMFQCRVESDDIILESEADQLKLEKILKYSPFKTNSEIVQQLRFDNGHGTKVVISNLWSEDGKLELNFSTTRYDIVIKSIEKEMVDCIYPTSLRSYLSFLYAAPNNLKIVLRTKEVQPCYILSSLSDSKQYKSKPTRSLPEITVTIGMINFAKDSSEHAPDIQGFNLYYKNRLIKPFWKVFKDPKKGYPYVVGVVHANFLLPTNNKLDFTDTTLLNQLKNKLQKFQKDFCDGMENRNMQLVPVETARTFTTDGMENRNMQLVPVETARTFTTNLHQTAEVKQSIKRLSTELQVFISRLPNAIQPYVIRATDVSRDGHCGFSVISLFTGNANGWKNVRSELLEALNESRYLQIYETKEIHRMKAIVDCFEKETLNTKKHWLKLPFMGPLIASCFNAILFVFDDKGRGTTYGPHFESTLPPDEFAIGFMDGNHFVQLQLEAGHPVPQPYYHRDKPDYWFEGLRARHTEFEGLRARHTEWNKASNITQKSRSSHRKNNKGESSSRPEPTGHPGNHEEEEDVHGDLAIGPFHEGTFGTKIQCGVREANKEGHSSRSRPPWSEDDEIPFNEEMGRTYTRYRVPKAKQEGRSSRSWPTTDAGTPQEGNAIEDNVIRDVNDGITEDAFEDDVFPNVNDGIPEAKEVHVPAEKEGRSAEEVSHKTSREDEGLSPVASRTRGRKGVSNDDRKSEKVSDKASKRDESTSALASRTRGRKKDSHDDTELREIREEIKKLEKKSKELRTQLEHLRNREQAILLSRQ